MEKLIFNRTQQDVDDLVYILDNGGFAHIILTSSDGYHMQTKFFQNLVFLDKLEDDHLGAYNPSDLNRVGRAVTEIAQILRRHGYSNVLVDMKTDWTYPDITTGTTSSATSTEMTHYLDEVKKVRNVLKLFSDTPKVPDSMEHLNYVMANDIEKILFDIYTMLSNIEKAWYYSGDLFAGEA